MNILVLGNFYQEAFAAHISESLEIMGHNVLKFEPGIKYSHTSIFGKRWNNIKYTLYSEVLSKVPSVQKKNIKPLFTIIRNNKIDLTLVTHDYLNPDEVLRVKKYTKAPVIIWFPDALSNFKKSMFLIAPYDYLFFVDKYIVAELRNDLNLNTYYLPQGCFPKYHCKLTLGDRDLNTYGCDIANVGNMYPSRMALYKQLKKYNIKMWGNPPAIWALDPDISFMMQGKNVHGVEKAKAFQGAKIVLNNLHPSVVNGLNKRTFEVSACSGFQLVKYRNALDELFVDGKEIVSYKSYDDLTEKIEYYLQHEVERKKIANASMLRAHKDHTLEIRLKLMFSIIFKS